MAAKKKAIPEAPEYPGDFTAPYNRIDRMGFMRPGFKDVAWVARYKMKAQDLKNLADWASKTAEYIEYLEHIKIK